MATPALSDTPRPDAEQRLATPLLPESRIDALERSDRSDQIASADPTTRSAMECFIDSFFQEKNIRWMLVIGAAIVFGSSLMLVTREWSNWPTAAQFLTILGYTAATFGFAELSRQRLGLLTTAKVLHLLTLLLLPVSFLSLGWLASHSTFHNALAATEVVGLLIPATFLTWLAATRIFDHWLRVRQTTFLFCYLALSIAGALPVFTSPWLAAMVSLILWMVMTIGVIKVNRHVFWLVEEYRSPRIFGFLPIGLLGLQFILLMAAKTWRAIPPEWLGLACVALAATILLTVRSLASVYRQRTGDLVRPLPWNITIPMMVGIGLTALGVTLSFWGFSYAGPTTYALVPTTLLAAGLMMILARQTRHAGFVWAALILVTVAYQTAPTLVADLVQLFKTGAAEALAEDKLPFAFYGLTYLPWLLLLAIGYRFFDDRKQVFISQPIQHFATLIAFILFAMSFTHLKAICLVSLVNVFLFALLSISFRDRRYMLPAFGGLILFAMTWVGFGNSMQWFELSEYYSVTSLAVLACGLVATRFPDRLIHYATGEFRVAKDDAYGPMVGMWLSYVLGMLAVAFLLTDLGAAWDNPKLIAFGSIVAAACLSTIRTQHYLVGLGFWLLIAVGASSWIVGAGYRPVDLIGGFTFGTTAVSLLVWFGIRYAFRDASFQATLAILRDSLGIDSNARTIRVSIPDRRVYSKQSFLAFLLPLGDLSFMGACILTAFFHLPMLVMANTLLDGMTNPMATGMAMVWMILIGLGLKNSIATFAALVALPLWVTAMVNTIFSDGLAYSTLPLVWSIVASVMLLVVDVCGSDRQRPAKFVGLAWLIAILGLSHFHLDLAIRAAGLVSLVAIGLVLRRHDDFGWTRRTLSDTKNGKQPGGHSGVLSRTSFSNAEASGLAILGNIQLLLLAASLSGLRGWVTPVSVVSQHANLLAWSIPVLGLSILFFDRRWSLLDPIASRVWTGMLRATLAIGVAMCFLSTSFSWPQILSIVLGIIIASVAEFCEAVRRQRQAHVWSGLATLGIAGIWLAYQGVIVFGAGLAQFGLLAVAAMATLLARRLSGHARFGVAARPMNTVSLALPGVIVVSTVAQEWMGLTMVESGYNSLALLAAAIIYFHHGLVTRRLGYHVAAGAIINVTLALLWNSMQLYDYQLYLVPLGLSIIGMVELLKKEIHPDAHDPIRYLGALTILVSPVFQIMNGSWWHLLSLMILSVMVVLIAIGLRVRVLVYAGSAFLAADMVAMVVRTTIDHPNLLWVGGLGVGVAVIVLAAICERHREQLLTRIRFLSKELATWN